MKRQRSSTGRSVLTIALVFAIISIVTGTAGVFRNSHWMVFFGKWIVFIGLFVFVRAVWRRGLSGLSEFDNPPAETGTPGRKISSNLIAMSSAAIVAVYASGYDRTLPAANRLAAHTAVRQGQYQDGDYKGWGSCPHGSIQVQVRIRSGQITSAEITQCKTRYPCSVIKNTPSRLVSRQITESYDNVTGATQSVDAYYGAVMDALRDAAKPD